jgi:hypothetical protein
MRLKGVANIGADLIVIFYQQDEWLVMIRWFFRTSFSGR